MTTLLLLPRKEAGIPAPHIGQVELSVKVKGRPMLRLRVEVRQRQLLWLTQEAADVAACILVLLMMVILMMIVLLILVLLMMCCSFSLREASMRTSLRRSLRSQRIGCEK